VDACATLLRHSDARLGWRKLPIGAAVIVHGFDIPFTDQAGFNRAFDKAKRIASNVGVPHFGVRTNIRDLPTNWEDSFAANVASVLHLFNEVYEGGVFASCEPYRFPILPWGSNPVSNPFQGASNFPVRTDGAELTRLEKIKLITENPVFAGNVRCCWEGKVAGNNCGKCEKCIRTQLELAAFGVDVGENFDQPLAPGMISNIRPRNEFQLIYRAEVLEFAEKNNLSAWWVEELREVVRRGLKPQSVPFQSLRRSQLWKAIRKYVR
jgi:hypothetical protein